MTVIAWRAGILAADRRVVFDDTVRQAPMRKLALGRIDAWRFAVAAAGHSDSDDVAIELAGEIVASRIKPAFKPPAGGGLNLIIAAIHDGRRAPLLIDYVANDGGSLCIWAGARRPDYFAGGSGGPTALGAMRAGASAIEAVRAANAHQTICGDGLNWVDTNLPPSQWRIRQRKA